MRTPAGRSLFGAIPAGRVRPAQQQLADAGMVKVVHSIPEALAALGETRIT